MFSSFILILLDFQFMSLNRSGNYQYYRPQRNSVSTTNYRNNPPARMSVFHMSLYFFIGFFFMYVGLSFFLNKPTKNPDAIALDGSTEEPQVPQQTEKAEGSVLSLFQPQATSHPNTLGVNTTQDEKLMKLIEEEIPKDNGEYAVVVKELNQENGTQVFINHQTIFPAGSLYKLYVMAAAMEKIEKGDMTLETVITAQANHLEEVLGSPDFGYEDRKGETISYTVEEILGRISRISDNYASIMLAEKLDWEYVRDYAKRVGASDTVIKSPISTNAKDTAFFFDLLYQKKIVSQTASDKLTALLKTAQLNQRIPAKLPKSKVEIAHKTGELPGVRHDAGIVYIKNAEEKNASESAKQPQKAYLIVLMSKDLKGEDSGVASLADISKIVYDYIINKK